MAPAVGDIAAMVAVENARFIVRPNDVDALSQALLILAADEDRRREIGQANRAKARAQFDEAKMLATYRRLYASALGRGSLD